MCHISCFMCEVSGFTCHFIYLFCDKVVELVVGDSVINGAYLVSFISCSNSTVMKLDQGCSQ